MLGFGLLAERERARRDGQSERKQIARPRDEVEEERAIGAPRVEWARRRRGERFRDEAVGAIMARASETELERTEQGLRVRAQRGKPGRRSHCWGRVRDWSEAKWLGAERTNIYIESYLSFSVKVKKFVVVQVNEWLLPQERLVVFPFKSRISLSFK